MKIFVKNILLHIRQAKLLLFLKDLLRGTLVYQICRLPAQRKVLDAFKGLDFKNIKKYYREPVGFSDCPRRVLVELLFFHPGANHASLIIARLLQKKYWATAAILVSSFADLPQIKLAKIFGINKYLTVYSTLSLFYSLKGLIIFAKIYPNLHFCKKSGISIDVEGVDIGRFVYDQYLRDNAVATFRELTFKYYLAIYRALVLYYRYKALISIYKPTDIVLSHNVYTTFGLIGMAAYNVDPNIHIWQAFGLNPIIISHTFPNSTNVIPPQYYDNKWADCLVSLYSLENLLMDYDRLSILRYSGGGVKDLDTDFIYKNIHITSTDLFFEIYGNANRPIFIFCHAFVDAVNYTKWQSYADHYTWLEHTLNLLAQVSKNRTIYVKAHPSESLYHCNSSVVDLLKQVNHSTGANFIYLDQKVDNRVIFNIATLIITASGTAGMEAVARGIPVITCNSCTYDEAYITNQAYNIHEYETLLANLDNINKPSKHQVERAKICIISVSKYMYLSATFLSDLSLLPIHSSEQLNHELFKLNEAYVEALPLEYQQIYKLFGYMSDNELSNSILLNESFLDSLNS